MSFRICNKDERAIRSLNRKENLHNIVRTKQEQVIYWDRATMSWREQMIIKPEEIEEDNQLRTELRSEVVKDESS